MRSGSYVVAAFVALLLLLCAGCKPKPTADGTTGAAATGMNVGGTGAAGTGAKFGGEANLLAGTQFVRYPPVGVSLNRRGEVLFTTMTNTKGVTPQVYRLELTGGKLAPPTLLYESVNIIHAYISAGPDGQECLILSNRKDPGGAVWDIVFRLIAKDAMNMVQYELSPGIPSTGKPDTWYGLEPFYSWDGAQVAVPLNRGGLVVQGAKDKAGKYVAYPQLPFEPHDMAFGALPDENGKRRLWASFWVAGTREDDCLLYALDLATMEWAKVFHSNWAIYHVGGRDLDSLPWVVAGSRAPADAAEGRRFARFGRIDPASGSEELGEFYGTPDFEVALEPHGDYIAYTDVTRQALVRLKPATGELDFDPRWYADDAKVFIGEGGEHVYAWKQGVLAHGEWAKHEQRPGWDSE